jgi:hypothetical protein
MQIVSIRGVAAAIAAFAVISSAAPIDAAPATTYAIVDPVLKMTAWTLAVPAGWKADGTMLPPPSCATGTTPVYKATSPDGRSAAYFLPQVAWAWGAAAAPSPDCRNWTGALSAQEFLNRQFAAENIGYVRTLTPEAPPSVAPGFTADSARYLGRYVVGKQAYDAVVSAMVLCHAESMPARSSCSALVRRWDGPAGTVVPNLPMFQAMRLTLNPSWMNAWTAAMQRRIAGMYGPETDALLRQGRLAQAARMQEHGAFMASQQRAADLRNLRFNQHEYTKQRNTDDFVDYVLDCSRFYNSQGTFRVSGTSCPNRQTM